MNAHRTNSYTYTKVGTQRFRATLDLPAADAKPKTEIQEPAVAGRTMAYAMVAAALRALFGDVCTHDNDNAAQERRPAVRATRDTVRHDSPHGDTVHRFTSVQRQRESEAIMKTLLFVIVGPDGIFMGCVTEKIQPAAERPVRASRPPIETAPQAAARESRRIRSNDLPDMPSRAGFEASGIAPIFPRGRREAVSERTGEEARAIAETRHEAEPVASQTVAPQQQERVQDVPSDSHAAHPEASPQATDDAASVVGSTAAASLPYHAYAEALARMADNNPAPSFAAEAPSLAKYDPKTMQAQYVEALQRTADNNPAPSFAAAEPSLTKYDPDAMQQQYAQALLRDRLDQVRLHHEHHAQKSAEEARRSVEEAKRLEEEARLEQDGAKAKALKESAKQFQVRAQRFEADFQGHRLEAENSVQKAAEVSAQTNAVG